MANLKSRIAKLEAEAGVGQKHYLNVHVRAGESLENALNRAAKAKGIAPEDVGYVELDGTFEHLDLELDDDDWLCKGLRVNGYKGPIQDLRGYLTWEEWLEELRRPDEL
jgi:hypothetical protein